MGWWKEVCHRLHMGERGRSELIMRSSVPAALEGTRMGEEKDARQRKILKATSKGPELEDWENEPPLEASQYVFFASFLNLIITRISSITSLLPYS